MRQMHFAQTAEFLTRTQIVEPLLKIDIERLAHFAQVRYSMRMSEE